MTLRRIPTPPLEDLACAALFAFFSMQGSIPGIAPAAALEMTSSAPTGLNTIGGIVSQATANLLILVLILRRPRLLLRSIPKVPWVALLALLAIASTAWSLDPALTLRRSIPFALAGLFGLYFTTRFPATRQFAILRLAMIAVALATVFIVILAPSIGLDHTPGHTADWQGVFTQKNACGRIMVLASAVILFGPRTIPARLAARIAALLLFLFVLIMSGSRGAWMIEAAILLLALTLFVARRAGNRIRLILAVAAPLAIALTAAAATFLAPTLMRLLGRDATLSGRTAIWAQVVHFIGQRPVMGYGYDAFWRGMQGPSFQIDAAVHFIVEHAHNGFLEICLELGCTGLALFLLSWLRAAHQLWPSWRAGDIPRIAFPLAILVLIALYDLDENTLLIYNGLFWPLYVAALATIDATARDRHHVQRPGPHGILSAQPNDQPVLQEAS
ncbi:MAG: O-antigen ligase [Acidobacteriaceae bacterium]